MADRTRRKSSILKAPKNPRAPLQDVSTLNVKSTQEDEVTSHTIHQQRRVSFAGKNLVKEFLAEAEIASVWQSPEYETLLVSSDSSGLPSDNSSSHSNIAGTHCENEIHSGVEVSGNVNDDEYDPSLTIMRQFTGKAVTKTYSKSSSSSRRTRFSFGENQVQSTVPLEGTKQPCETSQQNLTVGNNALSFEVTTSTRYGQKNSSLTTHLSVNQKQFCDAPSMYRASLNVHEKTNLDELEMDFTKPVSGVIDCGIKIGADVCMRSMPNQEETKSAFSDKNLISELGFAPTKPAGTLLKEINNSPFSSKQEDPANTTQCMEESMELTCAASATAQVNCVQAHTTFNSKEVISSEYEKCSEEMEVAECGKGREVSPFLGNSKVGANIPATATTNSISNVVEGSINTISNLAMDFKEDWRSDTDTLDIHHVQENNDVERLKGSYERNNQDHPADKTQLMNESMDFTGLLPSIPIQTSNVGMEGMVNVEGLVMFDAANIKRDAGFTFGCQTKDLHSALATGFPNNIFGLSKESNVISNNTLSIGCNGTSLVQSSSCKTKPTITSQEFTSVVPGSKPDSLVQSGQNLDSLVHGEHLMSGNQSQAMCTSMEVTQPLPGTIELYSDSGPVIGNADVTRKKSLTPCNKTQAMCTSMEVTQPLPGSIELGLNGGPIIDDVNVTRQVNLTPCNKTQAMCTSMELTQPLPGSIELGLNGGPIIDDVNVTRQVNLTPCNKTQAMCTSMELTQPLPGSIELGLNGGSIIDDVNVTRRVNLTPCNKTQAMCTSMEFTQPLLGTIELYSDGGPVIGNADVTRKKSLTPCNKTQAMCTSMEFTQPLPGSIELGLNGGPVNDDADVNSMESLAPFNERPRCTSDKNSEAIPGSIESHPAILTSNEITSNDTVDLLVIPSSRSPSPDRSLLMAMAMPLLTPPGGNLLYASIVASGKSGDSIEHVENPEMQSRTKISPSKRRFEELEGNASIHASLNEVAPSAKATKKRKEDESFKSHQGNISDQREGLEEQGDEMDSVKNALGQGPIMNGGDFRPTESPTKKFQRMESESLVQVQHVASLGKEVAPEQFSTSSNSLIDSTNSMHTEEDLAEDIDDIIKRHQNKPGKPQSWFPSKIEGDLWSIKFRSTCLELRANLSSSLHKKNLVMAKDCHFHFDISESTEPIIRWGMQILKESFERAEWSSELKQTTNFMLLLENIMKDVSEVRKFMCEMVLQEALNGICVSNNCVTFSITNWKCHLWFKVKLVLDRWDSYTPDHISVENIVGQVRECDVKGLITGVKKDVYFLRNYIRDVNEYVQVLEEY